VCHAPSGDPCFLLSGDAPDSHPGIGSDSLEKGRSIGGRSCDPCGNRLNDLTPCIVNQAGEIPDGIRGPGKGLALNGACLLSSEPVGKSNGSAVPEQGFDP